MQAGVRPWTTTLGQALAELLADVEADDLVRLRLIGALREVLG